MKVNWKQLDKNDLKILREKKEALKKDENVIFWFDKIDAKENTRRNYLLAIQYYTNYLNKSPQQLLDDAFGEIRAGKLMGERSIGKRITAFRQHLIKEHGMQPNTVRINLNGICSFYDAFDIDLPNLKKLMKRVRPLEENLPIPKKEDIQAALSVCDPLERAILLVGVASGLSMNEIRHLKIKDIRNVNPKTQITTLKLIRQKTDFDFTTFLTSEATQAVKDYLNWRMRTPKTSRRSALAKQAVTSEDNYVFIKRHIPDSWLKTHNEEERAINHDAFLLIYRDIAEKCGKLGEKGKRNLIRSHNIRKYFYNALKDAGCDLSYIEHWMGHQLDKTSEAYTRFDPVKQAPLYEKHSMSLLIEKIHDVENTPEFKSKQEEIEQLKKENQLFVVERIELQDAKTEIENLKKAQQEAENEYMALQADMELENKDKDYKNEQMQKQMDELRQMLLSVVQTETKKNLKSEPVKLSKKDKKEAEDAIKEMLE